MACCHVPRNSLSLQREPLALADTLETHLPASLHPCLPHPFTPQGYVGNWAGLIGASAAMAVGMYDKLSSVSLQPTSVWDVVPADMVAANILAAAAAVSAGAAAAISRVARSGVVKGSEDDARVLLGYSHPLSASERVRSKQTLVSGELGTFEAKVAAKCENDDIPGAEDLTEGASDLISAQCVFDESGADVAASPSESGSSSGLSLLSFRAQNPLYSSSSLTSAGTPVSAAHSLAGTQQLHHQRLPLLIVHAATSSSYPITLMEGWNYLLPFLEAHPPPFRCVPPSHPGKEFT